MQVWVELLTVGNIPPTLQIDALNQQLVLRALPQVSGMSESFPFLFFPPVHRHECMSESFLFRPVHFFLLPRAAANCCMFKECVKFICTRSRSTWRRSAFFPDCPSDRREQFEYWAQILDCNTRDFLHSTLLRLHYCCRLCVQATTLAWCPRKRSFSYCSSVSQQ